MAARGYTVLILPLGSALGSWDALRGFLRLRRLQGLERERDALLQGLELAERLRAWCQRHLQAAQRRRRHAQRAGADYLGDSGSDHSCLLLAKIQEHPPMLPPGPGPGPPCPTVEEAGVSAANAVGAARAEPLAHQGGCFFWEGDPEMAAPQKGLPQVAAHCYLGCRRRRPRASASHGWSGRRHCWSSCSGRPRAAAAQPTGRPCSSEVTSCLMTSRLLKRNPSVVACVAQRCHFLLLLLILRLLPLKSRAQWCLPPN
ncbi:suppressor APC domain-containing protein 1 isoform X5 [Alligator mississippiensis]|uniref:suppressor APC domain-containing protein 1 isoform X5 n=1 Tax=Alligator mississippiensis TaxID=8496 RepID=UPI002877AE5B|nr:suppressor APC domain-containing protein 1 isoform X5 [Alligator mississippiensis]